jgi:hypothetical protein
MADKLTTSNKRHLPERVEKLPERVVAVVDWAICLRLGL